MGKWKREDFLKLLSTNDKAVGRALVSLLEEQTFDEKKDSHTKYKNGRGFTKVDAKILTSMALQFSRKGYLTYNQLLFLRGRKGDYFPSRIGKYAAQLARKVNQRIDQLKFELQELESRSQNEGVKEQIQEKRKILNRISP